MSGNQNYYPQDAQRFQRPVKKRKHRFLKVVASLLIVTVLSMTLVNYLLDPTFISRLTKGFLFGFHTKQVARDELADAKNIAKPADKEVKAFSKFAKNLSNRIYLYNPFRRNRPVIVIYYVRNRRKAGDFCHSKPPNDGYHQRYKNSR